MELRHLRYFTALAETLHFGRAAQRLRVAQPSLSHQIKQLEVELQTPLFLRTRRRVQLTEAGRRFLDEAREILARATSAALMARRVGGGEQGRLRVGVGYFMDHGLIAGMVGGYSNSYSKVRVEIATVAVPQQLEALHDGHLDVGFLRPPVRSQQLNSMLVLTEQLLLAVPNGFAPTAKPAAAMSQVVTAKFVLPSRASIPVLHDLILGVCRDAGFVPDAAYEADSLSAMLALVSKGSCVAIVPANAQRLKPRRVRMHELAPSRNLETVLAWRRDAESGPIADFVRYVSTPTKRQRPRQIARNA